MASGERKIRPEGVDRNGLALLVFLLAFVVGYALVALIMAAVLEGSGESLPRDSVWKVFVFWAMIIAPQLVGILAALLAVKLFVGRYNRGFLFYVALVLGGIAVALYCLFLLVPPTARSLLLVLMQLATAWIGYLVLRATLKRKS